jgi:hypothetical protein
MERSKDQLWVSRSCKKIRKIVSEAGRISMRDLQRKTNYNRAAVGVEEPQARWWEALESLEKRGEIRFELLGGVRVEAWDIERGQRAWAVYQGLAKRPS